MLFSAGFQPCDSYKEDSYKKSSVTIETYTSKS